MPGEKEEDDVARLHLVGECVDFFDHLILGGIACQYDVEPDPAKCICYGLGIIDGLLELKLAAEVCILVDAHDQRDALLRHGRRYEAGERTKNESE